MKAFKKLALVSAIAAAPFAQAEMVAIDDALMGEMTGQSGISIELDATVSIGSVVYTDTDTAGSIELNTIVLGGNGGNAVAGSLKDIKIDIDVDAAAGLVIHLGPTDKINAINGKNTVDFGLSIADVKLGAAALGDNLASNIYIGGNIGPIDVTIANSGDIGVDAYFEVTDGGLDLDVLGVGVTNLTINDNSQPILSGAYALDMATISGSAPVLQGALDANAVAATPYTVLTIGADVTAAQGAAVTAAQALTDAEAADPGGDRSAATGDGTQDASDAATTTATNLAGLQTALQIEASTGSSVIAEHMNTSGVENMAYVSMSITTGTAAYTGAAITDALIVTVDAMAMDIGMDVSIGKTDGLAANASIGHVAINDLDLSGTKLTIYGH